MHDDIYSLSNDQPRHMDIYSTKLSGMNETKAWDKFLIPRLLDKHFILPKDILHLKQKFKELFSTEAVTCRGDMGIYPMAIIQSESGKIPLG